MLSIGLTTGGQSRERQANSLFIRADWAESDVMAFRSHVGRRLDLRLVSNRLAVALTLAAGLAAVVFWFLEDRSEVLWAPVHAFAVWSLVREIDPDHDWTALAAAVLAAVWALAATPMSTLALVGLALSARLVLNSIGRRPLGTDLAVLAATATVISVTAVGWVGGFGLTVAIYIDERRAKEHNTTALFAAGAGALGTAVVASLAGAFPRQLPPVRPLLVAAAGVLALLTVVREPEVPISQVDARSKEFLELGRLHASRGLIGVLVFVIALLSGIDQAGVIPLLLILALVLASNEVERIARTR